MRDMLTPVPGGALERFASVSGSARHDPLGPLRISPVNQDAAGFRSNIIRLQSGLPRQSLLAGQETGAVASQSE
jgi:hypothetical protein